MKCTVTSEELESTTFIYNKAIAVNTANSFTGKPITIISDPTLNHIPHNRLNTCQHLQAAVQHI